MDALSEQCWQADVFGHSNIIYLYCVDVSYEFSFTVPSLPFLQLTGMFGHVAFPASQAERRMVVFPRSEELLLKLKDIHSPCIIEVNSSVNFEVGFRSQYKLSHYTLKSKEKTCLQARSPRCRYLSFDHTSDHFLNFDFPQIHPEEVEDGLDKQEILIIWNFVVNTSMSVTSLCSLVRPKISTREDMPFVPLLDLNTVSCNCSNFPRRDLVILKKIETKETSPNCEEQLKRLTLTEEVSDDGWEEEDEVEEEEDVEDESLTEEEIGANVANNSTDANFVEFSPSVTRVADQNTQLFTETFTLKGSSFHEHFQWGLKQCKVAFIRKDKIPVKLVFEPMNVRDENAIIVQVMIDTWKPIGYIPGKKVIKVTNAISDGLITKIVLINVKYQYVHAISSYKYFGVVAITKEGKWVKDKDSYNYNEEL